MMHEARSSDDFFDFAPEARSKRQALIGVGEHMVQLYLFTLQRLVENLQYTCFLFNLDIQEISENAAERGISCTITSIFAPTRPRY
jgi:hypothetical protein